MISWVPMGRRSGMSASGIVKLEPFDHGAEVHGIPGAFFTQDDAAFLFQFLLANDHAVRHVPHEEHAFAQQLRGVVREFQLIHRFVERGVGIRVGPETHAQALEELHHFIRGIVLRAIEGHVLHEVREALLGICLHEGTGGDVQADADALRRLGVRENHIAEAVIQGAIHGFRIRLEIAFLLSPEGLRGGGVLGRGCQRQGQEK